MKYSHFNWDEVTNEIFAEGIECKGKVQLRLSRPAAVYVEKEGYEILLGYAATFDEKIEGEAIARIEAEDGLRVFAYMPATQVLGHGGESFTNVDRQTSESGAVLEVRRALMMQQRMHAQMMRDMKHERHKLEAARKDQNGPKKDEPTDDAGGDRDQDEPKKDQNGPKKADPGKKKDDELSQGDE